MQTIILPGYSLHNKGWAEEIAKALSVSGFELTVHNWKHWGSCSFSESYEVNKLIEEIGDGSEIKSMFNKINLEIKVVEKDRPGHSYPYPKDFLKFLKN